MTQDMRLQSSESMNIEHALQKHYKSTNKREV